MRTGSEASWHRLRIGIKRFRYIVENFLPDQHAAWSEDLKHLQDILGEVHDLDVLWPAAVSAKVFPDSAVQSRWHKLIADERVQRVDAYRKKTGTEPGDGKEPLWKVWRSELPDREQTRSVALMRLKLWASLLDPDFKHSLHVCQLSLQLYDGLAAMAEGSPPAQNRAILQVAALCHDVGRSKDEKGHHKASYRMIRDLIPPLGYSLQDLRSAAIVARYHRGALPRAGQRALLGLSLKQRQEISRLSAILRLANAFDSERDQRVQRLQVVDSEEKNKVLTIAAQGYSPRDNQAEAIAAARHLLETVYHRPVIIKPLKVQKRKPATRRTSQKPGARSQKLVPRS
jgi:exopolyphosphatase/guanosine-5'-triphosphate,3'-diphosphate pyrophosphatase